MKTLSKVLFISAVAIIGLGCLIGCTNKFSYVYENGDKYTPGDRDISEKIDTVYIDYMSGNVTLLGEDTNTVSIKETTNKEIEDRMKVHTWVDGSTLFVRYCASGSGFDFNDIEKKLEISVPKDVKLTAANVDISSGGFTGKDFEAEALEAHASSGGIDVDCTAKKISFDVSSGSINLVQHGESDEINIEASSGGMTLDIENAAKTKITLSSGKVKLNAGNIKELFAEASSGDMEFKLSTAPEKTNISASSGDVKMYLPEKSDITATIDTSSGDFNSDLSFSKKDGKYVCGEGTNKMEIETSSGDVDILKNTEE